MIVVRDCFLHRIHYIDANLISGKTSESKVDTPRPATNPIERLVQPTEGHASVDKERWDELERVVEVETVAKYRPGKAQVHRGFLLAYLRVREKVVASHVLLRRSTGLKRAHASGCIVGARDGPATAGSSASELARSGHGPLHGGCNCHALCL